MYAAAHYDHLSAVRLLLGRGADLDHSMTGTTDKAPMY
jgi:hypothetical protein